MIKSSCKIVELEVYQLDKACTLPKEKLKKCYMALFDCVGLLYETTL